MVNILIGATGSVATIKLSELVSEVQSKIADAQIKVVVTEHSRHFIDESWNLPVLGDGDEWAAWRGRGDPVLHIELRKWANVLLVAPLDANTLAKAANGLCDNLLTCVLRAWDLKRKPVVVCPAMNTAMWEHPLSRKQLGDLEALGYHIVPPVKKELVCGDVGMGAMASVPTIVQRLQAILQ